MFPLRDENPTELTPFLTAVFIALNVLAWLLLQSGGFGDSFVASLCTFGAIPANITGSLSSGELLQLGPDDGCRVGTLGGLTLVSSMFMHGSWMHLIGNMWFLWIFGNNIEDSMGHVRFLIFYILCGLLASVAHIVSDPGSVVPTVGASGAISGIMGAYVVLYPRVRVHTLIVLIFIVRVFPLPAWVLLVQWLAIQIFSGIASSGMQGGGVAFWAHVGGFVAGAGLIKFFERPQLVQAKRAHVRLPPEELRRYRW